MQTCEYCGFKSDNKNRFNRYSPYFHTCNEEGNTARFSEWCKCSKCDFTSKSGGGLAAHMRGHSNKEKKASDDRRKKEESKAFSKESDVRVHVVYYF